MLLPGTGGGKMSQVNFQIKDLEMQRVNEYRFYELGQKLGEIKDIHPDTQLVTCFINLWDAREAVDALISGPLELRVCEPVAVELRNAITFIVPTDLKAAINKSQPIKEEGKPDRPSLVGVGAYELESVLKKFEPVLAAECAALDTYTVSQKRGYSTPHLVEHGEAMLSLETVEDLGEGSSIISDIRSAGRCLAFDTPTAAGFHILRAVEAVMSSYYTHVTGRALKKQNRNWGLYLQKMAKEPGSDGKIRGALEHIKENYRNPISHPEITLSESHAVMLFGLSLSAIEIMAEAIRTTSAKPTEADTLKALAVIAEENIDVDDL